MNIRGVELALHPDEDLSNHIRREHDFFEAEILDYIRDNHPNHEVIIDIGANIGNHTMYFANFLTYKLIWAFEPIRENFLLLDQNIKNTKPHLGASVCATDHAISNVNGMVRITPNFGNMGASQISSDGLREVESITIDTLFAKANVTLLKIDVEGYEPEVIKGAQETINNSHPLILIEDWYRVYSTLLPEYEIEQAWPEHQTFLYRWKNET